MIAGSMGIHSGAADWEVLPKIWLFLFLYTTELSSSISLVITFQRSIFLQAWYLWRNKSISQCFYYSVEILEYSLRDSLSGASISSSSMGQEAGADTTEFITRISTSQQHLLNPLRMEETVTVLQRWRALWLFPVPLSSLDVCCVTATEWLWYST